MSKSAKKTPYVEDGAKGLNDIRNITVVQNDSDTYTAKVFNVEKSSIVPEAVTCAPGEQKPTGDMWTPWCDNQQALEEGHYIRITLTKRGEDDHIWQLMQSGQYVYQTTNMDYSKKVYIKGDFNVSKGEYKLTIAGSSVEEVTLTFNRYN